MLIFFASYVPGALTNFTWNPTALQAVVFGLTMYNGSVLAEVVRAGINAIPKGQSEAGYAVGLRKGQLMRLILVPQAITAMMPAIVSQLVVLLKDTALGTIIAYDNLTSNVSILQNLYTNAIPAPSSSPASTSPSTSRSAGSPPNWRGVTGGAAAARPRPPWSPRRSKPGQRRGDGHVDRE